MKRFFASMAAVTMGLAAVGTVEAGGHSGSSHSSSSHHSMSSYHSTSSYHSPSNYKSFKNYNSKTSFNSSKPFSKSYSYSKFSNYNLTHGTKFSYGYFYKGKNHYQWSSCCWSKKYGCYWYWDPCCSCYYYWCEPSCCYYPVSYIAVAPPALITTATVVDTTPVLQTAADDSLTDEPAPPVQDDPSVP